ncbi:phosphotriesterase family protein [Kitasatospora sp. P5_F3]
MTALVRTVLGDVDPASLGAVDAHDHLFLRTPRLPGQELDSASAAEAELRAFATAGGGALAQWTPVGLGRRTDLLPMLSRVTGVHLIAATGLHQAAHYPPELLDRLLPRLARLFITELAEGIQGSNGLVRAGMIKVAGGFHRVDPHARQVFAAAAEAHHVTGAPIGVHLEAGTGALETLDVLCTELGVPADRVILGHLNRMPDTRTHLRAAEAGAYLAFDGPSRAHHTTDWRLLDCLAALAGAGHADRLLIGGDTTTAAARATDGEGPGLPYLPGVLRPRIERELGTETAQLCFEANPARAFAITRRD